MKHMPLLFLGIFFVIAFSFTGIVLVNNRDFARMKPIAMEEGEETWPQATSGLAQQGKEVYIAQGCLYCHSQQVRRKGFGSDFERGWGDRQSVPRDYILQKRVQLGTSRTGPDLMTIGQRQPSAEWHYLHLYNPQFTSPDSVMPPFRYLFETRKIRNGQPTPDALRIPANFADELPPEGYEIVPTDKGRALVAYLLSLKLQYELPESRFSE